MDGLNRQKEQKFQKHQLEQKELRDYEDLAAKFDQLNVLHETKRRKV